MTIETAAIQLVQEHGFDAVTVEMICDASLTSPRTFCNYFGSKEGVILGTGPKMPSDEEIEDFVSSKNPDVLTEFLIFSTNTLIADQPDRELTQARQVIIQGHPELTAKRSALIARHEDQFIEIVEARLRAQGHQGSDAQIADEALMIVVSCTSLMGFMRRKWTHPDFAGDPSVLIGLSVSLLRTIATPPSEAP